MPNQKFCQLQQRKHHHHSKCSCLPAAEGSTVTCVCVSHIYHASDVVYSLLLGEQVTGPHLLHSTHSQSHVLLVRIKDCECECKIIVAVAIINAKSTCTFACEQRISSYNIYILVALINLTKQLRKLIYSEAIFGNK